MANFDRMTFDYDLVEAIKFEDGHIKVYHEGTFGKRIYSVSYLCDLVIL